MEYGAVLILHLVHAQTRTCTHFALQDRIHHATRTFWRRRPKHHLGLGIRAHLQAVTWARRHVFPCGVVVHQHRTVEDHATFQAQEQSVLGMGCVDSANPLPGVVRRPIFVACADSAFCHGLQKRDARCQTRGRCKPRHKRVRFFVGCGHQAISSLTQSYPFASNSRASSLGPDLTIWPSLNTCT